MRGFIVTSTIIARSLYIRRDINSLRRFKANTPFNMALRDIFKSDIYIFTPLIL
jgi:hypothetical protein